MSAIFFFVGTNNSPVCGLKRVVILLPQMLMVAPLMSSISLLVSMTLIFASLCTKVSFMLSFVGVAVWLLHNKSLAKYPETLLWSVLTENVSLELDPFHSF